MPIQYPNFPKLNAADMGAFDLGAAIKSGLGNYNLYQEAKYKPRNLQEALIASQQKNQINAPYAQNANRVFEADVGNKEGELSLLGYKKKLMEAQAMQAGASAAKAKQIADLYASVMNDNGAQNNRSNQEQQAENQGTMPSYAQNLNQGMQQPNVNPGQMAQSGINQKDKMRQNLVAHLLGLKPTTSVVDGKLVTNNPLFGVSEQKVGPSSFEKELSKNDAKHVFDLEGIVQNASNSQTTLDSLSDIVSSPSFDEMRQNPILGKYEMGYFAKFGTPEQQNMANQYMTVTGEIVKNAARDFKGQFRVGEQALISSMKPSTSDTAEAARAKTEALAYMNQMLKQRSEISADLIRKGVAPLEAYKQADEKVNGKELRKVINQRLHEKVAQPMQAKGESVLMIKNGQKYFIPADKAKAALAKGYNYER